MSKVSKKFGVRYGATIKKKYDDAQTKLKEKKKCPYCSKFGTVKRLAKGIWECSRCSAKFAGKAYSLA